ncbi:hypothetical protein [Streptomyces sp. NPDC057257]|uniref:hypothetical protein n=1 Tax=Streptomyces sp. NPDC057257 TaxID=3346071 RepID=UPI0036398918
MRDQRPRHSDVCFYWSGMALHGYADATVDAVERPERQVPSGRVPRRTALAVAGGHRSLRGALPLTGLAWAYDLRGGLSGPGSSPSGPCRRRSPPAAAGLGVGHPLARRLVRRTSPT